MSECSFETASSPFSIADNRCSDEDDDESVATPPNESRWAHATPTRATLPNLDDPFDDTPASLPIVSRPLPVVPIQRAQSPEQKVIALEQETARKALPGLGLSLTSESERQSIQTIQYSADGTSLRSDDQRRADLASGKYIEKEVADELPEPSAIVPSMPEPATPRADASRPATPRSLLPVRSPSPVLSRETIKAKLAERKAAKDLAKTSAFEPTEALAPPISRSSPELLVPDSPMSEVDYNMLRPQRKVSDVARPSTPERQVLNLAPEPASGRAIHHEREKRLSSDVRELEKAAGSLQIAKTFEAVNYDGDDYDDDIHNEKASPLLPPVSIKEDLRKSSIGSCEEVLRQLPEIPNVPAKVDVLDLSDSETEIDVVDEDDTDEVVITRSETLSLEPLSLSLDFSSFGGDLLGMEEFMTPEKRPETPITSRVVAFASPSKSSNTPSKLDQWVDMSQGPNKENDTRAEPATITSRGMKLRTRPSLTPADAAALAARRRQVSAEMEEEAEIVLDSEDEDAVLGQVKKEKPQAGVIHEADEHEAQECEIELEDDTRQSSTAPVMPVLAAFASEPSFTDINSAFDRVMQKQKRSYVIVEKQAVVHAKAEDDVALARPAITSAKGHTRQSSSVYTDISAFSTRPKQTENFKSHHRRQSSKLPPGVTLSPKPDAGTPKAVALPLMLDGGRLFVKVAHVKNLTLPIPQGEESFFSCTLDNGRHCVTTPWHTLAKNTKVDQEFELIADHDLEFILTLQAKYDPPVIPNRPKSTLGRLLHSPKRHRPTGSITSLSLAGYVGIDGAFARAYVALKHFRDKSFGRPYSMCIPVLNEWAMELTSAQGSKHTTTRLRKPYKIGEIELQVLYVPPVDEVHRPTLPTSLGQAVRDIRDAEWHNQFRFEGFLSQQGGDCPYWRRRQFRLIGSKLTAYHVSTGHIRATINLAKAVKITDDKESLTAPEVTVGKGENKKRRKSGFAEREEGHLYVAEGFRIRFANGELIDFYADSHAEKEKWMQCLNEIVGCVPQIKPWCQQVLEFEGRQPVVGVAK